MPQINCRVLFILGAIALGFELRVSHLLDRCSTTWATPPSHTMHAWLSQVLNVRLLWLEHWKYKSIKLKDNRICDGRHSRASGVFSFLFICCSTGFGLRASCLLGRCLYHLSHVSNPRSLQFLQRIIVTLQ
jgi:hypothetical protein